MRWRGIPSQNQLARISGVPQSCIHRILTRPADSYSPSRLTLTRLARALGTSVAWLADGVVPAADPTSAPAHGLHDAATGYRDGYCAEICARLENQPDSIKKAILAVVREFSEKQGSAGGNPAPEKSLA